MNTPEIFLSVWSHVLSGLYEISHPLTKTTTLGWQTGCAVGDSIIFIREGSIDLCLGSITGVNKTSYTARTVDLYGTVFVEEDVEFNHILTCCLSELMDLEIPDMNIPASHAESMFLEILNIFVVLGTGCREDFGRLYLFCDLMYSMGYTQTKTNEEPTKISEIPMKYDESFHGSISFSKDYGEC